MSTVMSSGHDKLVYRCHNKDISNNVIFALNCHNERMKLNDSCHNRNVMS